jgi:DeoR/GlpR family transcriptional regulator of sugar metabolism
MLAIERRKRILGLLQKQGIVTVSELSIAFAVSEETIRRDLQKMESENGVARTHGGAFISKVVHSDIPITIRENLRLDGKARIADLCGGLVDEGETVILDSSTTSLHIAERLKEKRNIVVITNALKIAMCFAGYDNIKVICIGGTLRNSQMSFIGPAAERGVSEYYADKAFVSCVGVDLVKGITDADEQEAEIRKLMLRQATRKILVADNTKLGKTSFSFIAPMTGLDWLVTDQEPDAAWRNELEARHITCLFPPEPS